MSQPDRELSAVSTDRLQGKLNRLDVLGRMTDWEIIMTLAEKVMEWTLRPTAHGCGCLIAGPANGPSVCTIRVPGCSIPDRSTWNPLESIADAMQISEKCGRFDMIPTDNGWMVGDGRDGYSDDQGHIEGTLNPFAEAPTLPRAICLAALKAVAHV